MRRRQWTDFVREYPREKYKKNIGESVENKLRRQKMGKYPDQLSENLCELSHKPKARKYCAGGKYIQSEVLPIPVRYKPDSLLYLISLFVSSIFLKNSELIIF